MRSHIRKTLEREADNEAVGKAERRLWARIDAIAKDLPGDDDIGTDLKALAQALLDLKNSR